MGENKNISSKNKTVTLILCIFGGYLGLHLFYVGRIKKGLIYFFTFGLFTIGWIIDILWILMNSFKDSEGLVLCKIDKAHNVPTQTCNYNTTDNTNAVNATNTNNINLVKVIDSKGNIEELHYKTFIEYGYCLYSEGGSKYHTYVGCYKDWGAKYQKKFKGWGKISLRDARKRGLTICRYCEERDDKYYN